MNPVISVLIFLLQAYILVIFIRVILSWLNPYPTNPVSRFFWRITEPVLAPVRRRLPLMSGIDFSPIVVWVVVIILIRLLGSFG